MTTAEQMNLRKLLPIKTLCGFAERMCAKLHFEPEELCPQTFDSDVMKSAARRILYVEKTANLLRRAICLAAPLNDVQRICMHLMVLIRTADLPLDYRRSEKELDIPALEQKYSQAEFLRMEVPFEEIERWVRHNGGYGVDILTDD